MILSRAKLAKLARAVACCLPEEWLYAGDPEFPGAIDGPGGMRLLLAPGRRGRVLGRLPGSLAGRSATRHARWRATIAVRFDRTPETIARAIGGRLLPVYVPLFRDLADPATCRRESPCRPRACLRHAGSIRHGVGSWAPPRGTPASFSTLTAEQA